jgi:phosphoribosyl-AMP cyclohydrolase / phosphoribosyl-ATP pyrophosphohydrolase
MNESAHDPADRRIRSMADIDAIAFGTDGLVPMIAQDARTGAVLMLAWANREAVVATLETGQAHFWSRSREELWRKGATSGHTLALASLHADCDGDALLARVRPAGPACHTGDATCFGEVVEAEESDAAPGASDLAVAKSAPAGRASATGSTLERLDRTLAARAAERPEGSYTVRLLDDANLRLKKLGEESAELVAALATKDRERAVEEAADFVYHALVALRAEGIGLDDLLDALEERAG